MHDNCVRRCGPLGRASIAQAHRGVTRIPADGPARNGRCDTFRRRWRHDGAIIRRDRANLLPSSCAHVHHDATPMCRSRCPRCRLKVAQGADDEHEQVENRRYGDAQRLRIACSDVAIAGASVSAGRSAGTVVAAEGARARTGAGRGRAWPAASAARLLRRCRRLPLGRVAGHSCRR